MNRTGTDRHYSNNMSEKHIVMPENMCCLPVLPGSLPH